MSDRFQKERPQMMKAVLYVREKAFLTPHYIRVVLEGDVAVFAAARLGDNNKIIVPESRTAPVVLPDFERDSNAGARPQVRTYTLRSLDLQNKWMTIDFVLHGDNGPASRWAIQAEKGDQLGVLMKVKSKPLFLPADWYFLAGDHTALPVVSVLLEALPATASGHAVLEVYSADDVLELKKPEGVTISWTFNNRPGVFSTLVPYFKTMDLPPHKSKFLFAAAEHHAIEEIQQLLRDRKDLSRQEWQAYAYWKFGHSEDASSQERRSLTHSDKVL